MVSPSWTVQSCMMFKASVFTGIVRKSALIDSVADNRSEENGQRSTESRRGRRGSTGRRQEAHETSVLIFKNIQITPRRRRLSRALMRRERVTRTSFCWSEQCGSLPSIVRKRCRIMMSHHRKTGLNSGAEVRVCTPVKSYCKGNKCKARSAIQGE